MQSDPAHGRNDDLVEKVARAMAQRLVTIWGGANIRHEELTDLARAVLAVARPVIREECARVAETMLKNYDTMDKIPEAIRAME
jgi:hypothetical protein